MKSLTHSLIFTLKIILASKSPRRQQLLSDLGIRFSLLLTEVDETYPADLHIGKVPEYLSAKKADAIRNLIKTDELLIAADTVVLFEDQIFGKPENTEEAKKMLTILSGNIHEVITGVTLLTKDKAVTFSELTSVHFRKLSDSVINHYVETFHPFDKAGGYAIQEWIGLVGIEKISGCYYNVMGLPVCRLVKELESFGINLLHNQDQ